MDSNTELATVTETALASPDTMRAALAVHDAKRQVVLDYISSHFVKGEDFGPADDRSPKDTLLKPGAEKICSLFRTKPAWRADWDTWKMLGEPAGSVCLICDIVSLDTGEIIGEGRGVGVVGEQKRTPNKATKIAEKRAIVDAALWTFNLSQLFTQDMEKAGQVNAALLLSDAKQAFIADVGKLRRGVESTLSDIQFIVAVVESELHRKSATTIGELNHVRESVIDRGEYDLATADRIPDLGGQEGGAE